MRFRGQKVELFAAIRDMAGYNAKYLLRYRHLTKALRNVNRRIGIPGQAKVSLH